VESPPPPRVAAAFAALAAVVACTHARAQSLPPRDLGVSSNWSGYVATGPSFSGVTGGWTVPATACLTLRPEHTAASFWVGLGGALPGSHEIEQIGTAAGCNADGSAAYYAWYELWPKRAVGLSLDIEPGDRMHASVTLDGDTVHLVLADATSGRRFERRLPVPRPDASSAEWIGEAPTIAVEQLHALEPLTKFGGVTFSRATATARGRTAPIRDSLWQATAVRLTGKHADVVPSALDASGTAFSLVVRG